MKLYVGFSLQFPKIRSDHTVIEKHQYLHIVIILITVCFYLYT